MRRLVNFGAAVAIALLPSAMKIWLLNRLGHSIHKTAKIKFSILNIDHIVMGAYTYIGVGNVFKNLPKLEMMDGSRINRWNKITSNGADESVLRLKKRASISLRHYFDVCDVVGIEGRLGFRTEVHEFRGAGLEPIGGLVSLDTRCSLRIGDTGHGLLVELLEGVE